MLLIHMVQQREYDDRTNFITPKWRMNMLEMTALHPINEEILACRAIAVLAEDTLAAAAVYVLAEDFSQDQGDELPLVESTSVPSKGEADETRQKKMRRRMNAHRMTGLRMRRTLTGKKEEEKKTRTDIYLYNNKQLSSSKIAAAWCVQRKTITGSIM